MYIINLFLSSSRMAERPRRVVAAMRKSGIFRPYRNLAGRIELNVFEKKYIIYF